MGVKDLRNKTPRTTTITKNNNKWISDYHKQTGIPETLIIEKLINIGIENLQDIIIPKGNIKNTVKKNTYFSWEHWLFIENFINKNQGVKKSGLINSLLTYAIQKVEREGKL